LETGAPVSGAPKSADAAGQRALPVRTDVRLLIVEDNEVNRRIALRYVQNAGYEADLARNGREALEAIARYPYEIVLMDLQMPEMDGLEASRRIREAQAEKRPAFAHEIFIIAMTANAMEGDREACLAAGMDDYLSKPVVPAALKQMLEKYTALRHEHPAGTGCS
jgi:CheY-like chemotaxis protein